MSTVELNTERSDALPTQQPPPCAASASPRVRCDVDSTEPTKDVQVESQRPKPRASSLPTLLAATTVSIAVASVGLTLIGVGVAFAAESFSGLPFTSLLGSTLDASELSAWGLVHFVDGLLQVQKNWRTYGQLALTNFMYFGGATLVGMIVARIGAGRKRSKSEVARADTRSLMNRLLSFDERDLPFWSSVRKIGLATGAMVGAMTLLQYALLFSTLFVLGMLALLPAVGMAAGQRHLMDYVVQPTQCVPLKNREERLSTSSVAPSDDKRSTCVEISKEGTMLGRGRVVFSTSSATLLFDPVSGGVTRSPTDGAVIKVVDAL
jgi:hypothetical protein